MGRPAEHLSDLAAGREEAFAQLYDEFGTRLLRAAWSIAGRREDAEDAVQDVFVGLVRAGNAVREIKDLNAYLFSAVHRAAVKRTERRRGEQPVESQNLENIPAQSPAEAPDSSDRLSRALASLPEEQRAVIVLKVDGGLTFEQIGEALKTSANTAASRYRYALEKLRAVLGDKSVPATASEGKAQ